MTIRFSMRTALIAFLFIPVAPFAAAARDLPDYPPSAHPDFELVDSTPNSARFRFRPAGDDPGFRSISHAYLGIPPGSEYEYGLQAWDFRFLDDNARPNFAGGIESSTQDLEHAEEMTGNILKIERSELNDLDVLRFEFTVPKDTRIFNATNIEPTKKYTADLIEMRVRWTDGPNPKPKEASKPDAGFQKIFGSLLLNAADAADLRRKRDLPAGELGMGFSPVVAGYQETGPVLNLLDGPVAARPDAVRVSVRRTGVTAVRPEDLREQGVDPSTVDLSQARLWHKGAEIPAAVLDDGDGVFGGGDGIFFYGLESDSEYTNDAPYYLTWNPMETPPLRAAEWDAPGSAETARETVYARLSMNQNTVLAKINNNHYEWFFKQLDERNSEIPLDLPAAVPRGRAQIALRVYNKTRGVCGFSAGVGSATARFEVDMNEEARVFLIVPAAALVDSPTLAIRQDEEPAPVSGFQQTMSSKVQEMPRLFVESVEVIYPRSNNLDEAPLVMDRGFETVSAPVAVKSSSAAMVWGIDETGLTGYARLPAGGGAIAPAAGATRAEVYRETETPGPWTVDKDYPSTLHRPDQGYDYVIVAHGTLTDAVRPLAERRAAEGFKVLVTGVQDIYDEFNHGYPSCDAIKRFLRHAQSQWRGLSPEFLVLAGESSWDRRDYEGYHSKDQVPTYTPPRDPQHFGSDEWYAYLWTEGDTVFSDLIVGRISVMTPEEVTAYSNKLAAYETSTPVGPWKARHLFISDDTFDRWSEEAAREGITEYLYPAYVNQGDYPHQTNPYLYQNFVNNPDPAFSEYTNKKFSPDATYATIGALDEGALIVQYFGHGGAQLWSHERLFYATDRPTSNVLELKPTNTFPFILNWSCLTGYLNLNMPPFNVCLAEEFIRHEDRGAIALWAPSENGTTDQHMIMSHLVMRNLLRDGMTRLGEAATFTKIEYLQTRQNSDLMQQYILFGDPGAQLQTPAETLDVSASPTRYTKGETEIRVETRSKTLQNGKALVFLNAGGFKVYESGPIEIQDGWIRHRFAHAFENDDDSPARIQVYAWNEEENADAWGGFAMERYAPRLALNNGAVSLQSDPVIAFEIENPSAFGVENLICSVDAGGNRHRVTVPSVPANSVVEASWSGPVPPDVHAVYVSIETDSVAGLAPANDGGSLAVAIPGAAENEAVPLLGLMTLDPEEVLQSQLTRVQIPFRALSASETVAATATLRGPGSATAPKTVLINDGRDRRILFTVTPPERGTLEYALEVDSGGRIREYPVAIEVMGKPDLALAEGDIAVSPEQTVVGKTVYMRTNVFNVGDAPATNVTVAGYDGDPSNNNRLSAFNHQYNVRIDRIEPGGMEEVEVVWDPPSYDGAGMHEIHLVVDPYERVDEMDETNNRNSTLLELAELPELAVRPWEDHGMQILSRTEPPVWGQPLQLHGRVRNEGGSDAQYVRLTFELNGGEINKFFPSVRVRSGNETRFEVPLVSARNTLRVVADKYNLIGERIEPVAPENDNNESREKRLYTRLQMPPADIADGKRRYEVTNETQFAAGFAEYARFDKGDGMMRVPYELERAPIRLNPVFALDPDAFSEAYPRDKWQWNAKYNVFCAPAGAEAGIGFDLPAPNGRFGVYAQMYSDYKQAETQKIAVKTAGDADFRVIEHFKTKDGKALHKIGEYTIRDGNFTVFFRSVPGGEVTNLGDIVFVRPPDANEPVTVGYESPYFPAEGSGAGPVSMAWTADVPPETELRVRGRWVMKNPDGTLRFFPWMRTVDGRGERLELPGKGDYFQYAVDFVRHARDNASAGIGGVSIEIPCRAGR